MVNPKSLANLRPFKPGNQAASTKQLGDVSLTAALKRYYRANPKEIDTLAESVARQAHESPAYAREVWERLDGKVPQPITGAGGGPLSIQVVWDGNRNKTSSSTP